MRNRHMLLRTLCLTAMLSIDVHSAQQQLTGTSTTTASTNLTEYSSSRVSVHIPFSLHQPEGFEHVKADFGFGPNTARGSIHAFVYFVDGPLCDPISSIVTTNNTSTTSPHVYPEPKDAVVGSSVFQTPFILLARSDHCSNVVKVRNAQAVGAAAVVIGHDQCRCSDTECTKTYGPKCINTPIVVVNDGSAGDITIPSFLLYHVQSEAVMDAIKNKKQSVLMELTWGLQPITTTETPSNPVMYYLWTSANDPIIDVDSLRDLRIVNQAFEPNEAYFTPRYSIVDGSRFDCTGTTEVDGPCDHLCSNHGRYCTVHARDLSGYAILQETVRQLCIWDIFSSADEDSDLNTEVYWDYVIYHRSHCSAPHDFADAACIRAAYEHAKIPLDHDLRNTNIDTCMDTGNLDDDAENEILAFQLKKQVEFGIYEIPSLLVNKHQMVNEASPSDLFFAICEYYESKILPTTHYPAICDTCGTCENAIGCLEQGHCVDFAPSNHANHSSYGNKNKQRRRGWFWTFFLLFLIGGGAYYYYVYYRNGISFGIRSDRAGLLHNYFQLGGSDQ